jgi:hypothetical protein
MCGTKAPVIVLLLLAALVINGCRFSTNEASLARDAVARSNQEAERLYDIRPFRAEHGHVRVEGRQSIWEALAASGGNDVVAKVVFDEEGAIVEVDVKMLAHPTTEPAADGDAMVGPDADLNKQPRIPEVMPK